MHGMHGQMVGWRDTNGRRVPLDLQLLWCLWIFLMPSMRQNHLPISLSTTISMSGLCLADLDSDRVCPTGCRCELDFPWQVSGFVHGRSFVGCFCRFSLFMLLLQACCPNELEQQRSGNICLMILCRYPLVNSLFGRHRCLNPQSSENLRVKNS